ncbi:MAG: hypothetical protein WBP85_11195, partial [Terracidiphilus sp.]
MKGNGDRFSLWAASIAGAVLVAALLAVAYTYFTFLRPGTPISSLRNVQPSTPVHLIGVVTYADEVGHRFWLEDETGVAVIPADPVMEGVQAGQTVAVDARKMGQYDPAMGPASLNLQIVRVRPSRTHTKLPPPTLASTEDFPPPEKDGVRVQIEGVIEQENTDTGGHAWLNLTAGGKEISATIAKPSGDISRLLDAKVRIVGVAEQVPVGNGNLSPRIWVPSASGVQVLEPLPDASPLESTRDLYREDVSALGHRVLLRGRVAAVYPGAILIEDPWGAIEARLADPPAFRPGAAVEVTGFPFTEGLAINLRYAQAKEIPAALLEQSGGPAQTPIATIAQLRALPPARAALALPVDVTGVITFVDSIWRHLYLQDATSGVYVKFSGQHPELRAGVRVHVAGISNPGNYAPV